MKDRERLINYYLAGRLFLPRPRYLCFMATLRCNGRCGHCGIWRTKFNKPEMSAEELAALLDQPFFHRVETAWLTGGEPTLREDLPELGKAMTESLPSLKTLGLATNGLAPERVSEQINALRKILPEGRSLFVHLSLDGAGAVHDRIRNLPGAFSAAVKTLELVRETAREPGAPVEVALNCVIQPENASHLREVHEFAKKHALPLMFNVALITDQIYKNQDRKETLCLSEEEKKEVVRFLKEIIPESPPPLAYQHRIVIAVLEGKARPRRCLTLYTTVNLYPDGSLLLCPASSEPIELPSGKNVDRLWKSSELRNAKKSIERKLCKACMLSCSLGDSMPLSEWLKGGWE